MRKLSKQEILSLTPSEKEYYVVLSKFNPHGTENIPIWSGLSKLYIAKNKRGDVVTITPTSYNWAEASYRDVCDDGEVMVEEYSMKVYENE